MWDISTQSCYAVCHRREREKLKTKKTVVCNYHENVAAVLLHAVHCSVCSGAPQLCSIWSLYWPYQPGKNNNMIYKDKILVLQSGQLNMDSRKKFPPQDKSQLSAHSDGSPSICSPLPARVSWDGDWWCPWYSWQLWSQRTVAWLSHHQGDQRPRRYEIKPL